MRVALVVRLTGALLRLFGLTLLAPAAVALLYRERQDALGFFVTAAATCAVGTIMRGRRGTAEADLRRMEALAIVAGTWLLVALSGAAPYLWVGFGAVDAFFESMSGLTTTGATILTDFGAHGRGLFFWRATTQWLGGMGVITLFIAVLPRLAIGGRQLFFAEVPGPTEERLTPQVRKTAALLWRVYLGLTIVQILALIAAGMSLYEATCHAFTTLSTGGFSPHPLSIQGYANPAAEWIIILFMFIAGANFALHYRVIRGQPAALARDEEFRAYTLVAVLAAAVLTLFIWRQHAGDLVEAIRLALFQVLTILTTTGYASADFDRWNDQARMLLLILMFIGGCAGSTAGGPKIVRQVLIARYTLLELKRVLHPKAMLPVKLGGRVIPDEVMRGVLVFFLFYLLVFAVCVFAISALGADIVTAITATIASLGNIGPGLAQVGPMESYAHFDPASKIILALAMWIGRLEVLTVLALLRPEVWRTAGWRDE